MEYYYLFLGLAADKNLAPLVHVHEALPWAEVVARRQLLTKFARKRLSTGFWQVGYSVRTTNSFQVMHIQSFDL